MSNLNQNSWITRGFESFSRGQFDNGGDNLYVNARGVIETIHRTDVNNDGNVDLIFSNSHGYIERGPTLIYKQPSAPGTAWDRRELPNDSGWMSKAMDIDGDGYLDLIVVNGENGVTSELNSYVYWGGPSGLTGDRTEFPTAGAYDVAVYRQGSSGASNLIFPSAWVDHHNPGKERLVQVYEQTSPRHFEDVSEQYGLIGVAALAVVCEDLTGNGYPDLVVANYREDFEYDIESFIYWGTEDGFDADNPFMLPTHFAQQVVTADLNGDGHSELVFTGGNRIFIYWNRGGSFDAGNVTILEAEGNSTMFCQGSVRVVVADTDGDGLPELIVATRQGVEIRKQNRLNDVETLLPLTYCGWIDAVDLNGDGLPEILASRYQNGKNYETESMVFWNSATGFLPENVTLYSTAGAMGCTAADLDMDGHLEVIFNNTMGGPSQFDSEFPLYVYLGDDEHNYGPSRRQELPTGGGTNTYVLADLGQDGYPDLVVTSPEGLRIFHGGPEGLSPDRYQVLSNAGQVFHYVLVGDFDRNGWLDLLGVAYTYDDKPGTLATSSFLFKGGPEGFSPDRGAVLPTYCSGNAQVVDVDNDGWLDLVLYNPNGFLVVYYGGETGFSTENTRQIQLDAQGVVCAINRADLNGNGWLDLIVVVMGHYSRGGSGFYILEGGPTGYSEDRVTFHGTTASSIMVSAADLDRSGHLDLLVPAYSTQFTRELPALIFSGEDGRFDFDDPTIIPCDSSCAFVANDITGNGYPDLLTICHRNDLGHQVESLLFWNGPDGMSFDRVTRLPGMGPHLATPHDFGNARDRKPVEYYLSEPFELGGRRPELLDWRGTTPLGTDLRLQIRWAEDVPSLEDAHWYGQNRQGTYFETPGSDLTVIPPYAQWVQYRAGFFYSNGCNSPALEEVSIDLAAVSSDY